MLCNERAAKNKKQYLMKLMRFKEVQLLVKQKTFGINNKLDLCNF
jgi:hypothetical protein